MILNGKGVLFMKQKDKKLGKCAICGEECELTYEHIPPKRAFNSRNVKGYFGDEVLKLVTTINRKPWDTTGLKYIQMQKGTGKYSLCMNCNNYTGSKYGDFYNAFVYKGIEYIDTNFNQYMCSKQIRIRFNPFFPLRFIKQVLSMFCSTTQGLSTKFEVIRDLLLDDKKNLKETNFKISMGMVKNQMVSWTGCMGDINIGGKARVLSEIIAFPFVYVFDYDKSIIDTKLIDITNFLMYSYDESIELDICLPVVERNIAVFPDDYRTKQEIINIC